MAIVAVRGEHDLLTKAELAEALERASAQHNVLVDLSECSFMHSSVIGALFVASKSIEERDGRLELVIPPEAHILQRVANIAGLASIQPRSDGGQGVTVAVMKSLWACRETRCSCAASTAA